ncbi:MAG: hypothetical protein DRJ60_02675 [Thermoprotei archaeon]|nr:MAG: hypothetical protein DRJ60_02675 [Thermoprotei archaeon]
MSGYSDNRKTVIRIEAGLPRELGLKFKKEAYRRKGFRKGALKEALIEAIKLYLNASRQDIEEYISDVKHEELRLSSLSMLERLLEE